MRWEVYDGIAMWNALEANRCYSFTEIHDAGLRKAGATETNVKYWES